MLCPHCKMNVEDDSYFCDQCGQEIWICPKCNKVSKGKICIYDGTALVSARTKVKIATSSSTGGAISHGIGQVPVIEAPPVSTCTPELHLINKNLGLDLKIDDDEIVRRTVGRFAEVFNRFSQVSRQHCRINFDPKDGWTVTDLGSTNGTKYNGTPLKQGQPQPLADKSFLLIANIEFYVEIRSQADKTVRLG